MTETILTLDVRKLVAISIGLASIFQFPLMLGNAFIDSHRPYPSAALIQIELEISTIVLILGIAILTGIWLLQKYPYMMKFPTEETEFPILEFRTQIFLGGAYYAIIVPLLSLIIALLAFFVVALL